MSTMSSTRRGNAGVDGRALRHVPDPRARLLRRTAEHLDRAALGLEQPEHELKERRLATAVGPDHADELVAADLESRAVDGVDLGAGIAERHLTQPNGGIESGHGWPIPLRPPPRLGRGGREASTRLRATERRLAGTSARERIVAHHGGADRAGHRLGDVGRNLRLDQQRAGTLDARQLEQPREVAIGGLLALGLDRDLPQPVVVRQVAPGRDGRRRTRGRGTDRAWRRARDRAPRARA